MQRKGDVVELHGRRQAVVARRVLGAHHGREVEGAVGRQVREEACRTPPAIARISTPWLYPVHRASLPVCLLCSAAAYWAPRCLLALLALQRHHALSRYRPWVVQSITMSEQVPASNMLCSDTMT